MNRAVLMSKQERTRAGWWCIRYKFALTLTFRLYYRRFGVDSARHAHFDSRYHGNRFQSTTVVYALRMFDALRIARNKKNINRDTTRHHQWTTKCFFFFSFFIRESWVKLFYLDFLLFEFCVLLFFSVSTDNLIFFFWLPVSTSSSSSSSSTWLRAKANIEIKYWIWTEVNAAMVHIQTTNVQDLRDLLHSYTLRLPIHRRRRSALVVLGCRRVHCLRLAWIWLDHLGIPSSIELYDFHRPSALRLGSWWCRVWIESRPVQSNRNV